MVARKWLPEVLPLCTFVCEHKRTLINFSLICDGLHFISLFILLYLPSAYCYFGRWSNIFKLKKDKEAKFATQGIFKNLRTRKVCFFFAKTPAIFVFLLSNQENCSVVLLVEAILLMAVSGWWLYFCWRGEEAYQMQNTQNFRNESCTYNNLNAQSSIHYYAVSFFI